MIIYYCPYYANQSRVRVYASEFACVCVCTHSIRFIHPLFPQANTSLIICCASNSSQCAFSDNAFPWRDKQCQSGSAIVYQMPLACYSYFSVTYQITFYEICLKKNLYLRIFSINTMITLIVYCCFRILLKDFSLFSDGLTITRKIGTFRLKAKQKFMFAVLL